jgi:hypothetical protein
MVPVEVVKDWPYFNLVIFSPSEGPVSSFTMQFDDPREMVQLGQDIMDLGKQCVKEADREQDALKWLAKKARESLAV